MDLLASRSIGFGVNMVISSAEVDHHVPSASPFKTQTKTDRVGGEDGERGKDEAGSSARVAGASEQRESQDEEREREREREREERQRAGKASELSRPSASSAR